MYTPRSSTARPRGLSRWARLLYGVFPGLRTMAFEDFAAGAPIAGLGLVVAAVGIFLFTSLDVTAETLRRVEARPELLLVQIGLVVLMVAAFEGLRLGSSGFERSRGPRAPRVLAAACLPSTALWVAALAAAPLAPRLTQAAVVLGLLLCLGSLPAAVFCVTDMLLAPSGARRRYERLWVGGAGAISALTLLWLIVWPHPAWSARADWTGWEIVAALLE